VLPELRYCQRCGEGLAQRAIESKLRAYCPACGYVVYLDPKVAAVVLVETEGKLVLVRRANEPELGRWSFPSGYVDRGESVEDAAVREVKEETGLDVEVSGFVGLYSRSGSTVVLAVYTALVRGGALTPGPEVTEVAEFDPDELPPLPFPHDYEILRDWRGGRAKG
jgi:ADP-ribose pyrophosphatase YjhB (NUDIX family)